MVTGGSGSAVLRGEIYWIDWEPHRGSEQAGRRPGIVISSDTFNRLFRVCTVLALTTKVEKYSPLAVRLPDGLTTEPSVVLPWQVMTVSVDRLDTKMSRAGGDVMKQIDDALRLVWTL